MATATPTKNTVPTSAETPFGVARCKLLAKYPLYRYQEQDVENHYRLSVLLIGSVKNILNKEGKPVANHLKELLGEFLANGQLLETALHVTVLSETAEEDAQALRKAAPHLHRFIRIESGSAGAGRGVPVEWDLGTLSFVQELPEEKAAALAAKHRYVFISTGDNDRNQRIAENCSCRGVLAFTRDDDIQVCLPKSEVLSKNGENDAFMEQIYSIAHNLYFVYAKSHDVRETRAAIRNGFDRDDYNRLSDLEAALHVRSKLACCGITDPDLKKAAAQFAEKIGDENLLEDLAELEHRRWCVSKMMQGFYCPADVSGIYQNGNETHSRDPKDKWHTILVPYENKPEKWKTLSSADWDVEDVESIRYLDALDMQTLRIHKRCNEVAQDKAHRDALKETMESIQNICIQYADEFADVDLGLLDAAVRQLWQRKQSMIPVYKRCVRGLRTVAEQPNFPLPKEFQKLLDELERLVAPQIEFAIRKDYKELNRTLVRQIPFALTHKPESVLVKLMAAKETDCIFSPWQMEPTKVVYVEVAENQEEMWSVSVRVRRIDNFLSHNNNGIRTEYHILVPAEANLDRNEVKRQFGASVYHLHPVASLCSADITAAFAGIMAVQKPDYIDPTGGNPILTCVAERYAVANDLGAFYIHHGKIRNIWNARELNYPAPRMDLTVQEMFDQSGAVLRKSDGGKMSDLTELYGPFWEAVREYRDNWYYFCRKISDAYDKMLKNEYRLRAASKTKPVTEVEVTLGEKVFRILIPIFRELRRVCYLNSYHVEPDTSGNYRVKLAMAGATSAKILQDRLNELNAEYNKEKFYSLTWDGEQPVIHGNPLYVDDLEISSDEKNDHHEAILKGLEKAKVIYDRRSTGSNRFFLRFQSPDILAAMRNSGKVLEYYIYYTAILECEFDDVDMSSLFAHFPSNDRYQENPAENELDVICTKGAASLFISAKNVKEDNFEKNNFLNYVCYEVSLLADRFGINAKRVLVAPGVEHFDKNGDRMNKVKKALSRNVYLVGDALCKGDKLGKVLKKIAAGDVDWDKV